MDLRPAPDLHALLPAIRAADALHLMLDYDGTLVPHITPPELARPDPELLELLARLAARPRTDVHIVSGRTAVFLDTWLAGIPVSLHAEHGALSREAGASKWNRRQLPSLAWRDAVRPVLSEFVSSTPGALLELKESGIAWHWRGARATGARQSMALASRLADVLVGFPVEILEGDMVLELRPKGVHKGLLAGPFATRPPGHLIIAAGNDRSDEDLFAALDSSGITIVVGTRPSIARYRVPDSESLRAFLGRLTE